MLLSNPTLSRPPRPVQGRRFPVFPGRLPSFSIQAFLLLQIACQVGLLFESLGQFRAFLRVASFAVSLVYLAGIALLPGKGRFHLSAGPGGLVLVVVLLALFHPLTSTLLAGTAQLAFYAAILAPLFWMPGIKIGPEGFRRIILTLWAFNALSSGVGVLQVHWPGTFQPHLTSVLTHEAILPGFEIQLSSGEWIYRPMGLTDKPAGAALASFYSILFALGLLLTSRRWPMRLAYAASMALGFFCIYLAQVRAVVVVLGICLGVMLVILVRQWEWKRALALVGILTVIVAASFFWAVSIAGDTVTGRLQSLVAKGPAEVYYQNRGLFLQHTVEELLPQYPLGAGLGRWGMTSYYFGDKHDPARSALYAEIQWTGWLFDGGIPLILAYTLALLLALYISWKVAVGQFPGNFRQWGVFMVAYNVGALAATFSYPWFMGQSGLEFWLLNAALFSAACAARQAPAPSPHPLRGAYLARSGSP